jgi:hypothetical protein
MAFESFEIGGLNETRKVHKGSFIRVDSLVLRKTEKNQKIRIESESKSESSQPRIGGLGVPTMTDYNSSPKLQCKSCTEVSQNSKLKSQKLFSFLVLLRAGIV